MTYLLDTDICIYLINRRAPHWQRIADRIIALTEERVLLSALTVAELRYGIAKSERPIKNQAALDAFLADFDVIAFNANAAMVYGKLRAALEKKERPIGPVDTLIAAHAVEQDATLITHNTTELSRVPGLRLQDWTQPV